MSLVVSSWERIKAIDSYYEIAGEMLFKRLFEINPDVAAYFKFTDGYETTDEALYKQEVFKKHATGVILTVTAAVSLLEKGDMDTLVGVLKDLGARHLSLGLKLGKSHYDLVGQALLDTLAKVLDDEFTSDVKEAWVGVYEIITDKMMEGAAQFEEISPEQDESGSTSLVVNSWSKVRAIENYDEVAGEMLFKRLFEINPDSSRYFKFTDGFETTDEALYKQQVFKNHASGVVLTVSAAVDILEKGDFEKLTTVLKGLGATHLSLGLDLEKAHYDLVGKALLDTLEKALGDDFTAETKAAWSGVYAIITEKMMEGAAEFKN
ncbi:globin-like protein [Nitzschia inconspicua]|uniref:Globin-like protein n=1 Tax=Nitzschia inconspicua TaxID=303405 RepID=A0A9K3PIB8_9STRA|nr:globin-like protein [Nitzschia inconspicua]